MKKTTIIYMVLIMVVLMVTFTACKKKKPNIDEPDNNEPIVSVPEETIEDEESIEEIMKDFSNIVESKNEPNKIVEFLNKNIEKVTTIEADIMVIELEKVLEESLESVTDNISELDSESELISIGGNELFFPEDKVKDIKNDRLREEVIKNLDSKYKLINLEGSYYPIIDYEKFREYDPYISPELKEYIIVKAMDSNAPVAIDAGLYISYDELSNRILKTEEYVKSYNSQQKRYEEMLKSYKNKLRIYLLGIDNTPIADHETGKIHDNVIESYEKTGETKDTITGFIVRKHLKNLEENDYIINDKIKNSVLSLINEALSLLEETK